MVGFRQESVVEPMMGSWVIGHWSCSNGLWAKYKMRNHGFLWLEKSVKEVKNDYDGNWWWSR